MDAGEYWVYVDGSGYFVRFESHGATPRWFTHKQMCRGYCFKRIEDARRVADQLGRYGRTTKIMRERRVPPPPPQPPFGLPRRLRPWIDRIVAASNGGDVKIGYRTLARQHHPDKGGETADMQALTEAWVWLRGNPQADAPFEPETPFGDLFNTPPPWESMWDPMQEPISELTDDDIPF
jgi:hypothetical protein